MQTFKILTLIACSTLLFSAPAHAADLTLAKDFEDVCEESENVEICTAYIEGYRHGFILGLGWGKNEFDTNNVHENTPLKFHSEFCVEKYNTNEELLKAALSYFDYHSKVLDQKTPIALGIAFKSKYPCPTE